MALPKLTIEQKHRALQKAQILRSERAHVREQLKRGQITLAQVLRRSADEVVGRMRVLYLIESLPQVGKVTSKRIMQEIGIHSSRRVQGLGKRQVDALLAKLG